MPRGNVTYLFKMAATLGSGRGSQASLAVDRREADFILLCVVWLVLPLE